MHRLSSVVILFFASSILCGAQGFFQFEKQTVRKSAVSLEWDVDLDYRFDNREFDASSEMYASSETVHGVFLTPSVGVGIRGNGGVRHFVCAGIDLYRRMGLGEEGLQPLREMTLYYDVHVRKEKYAFEGVAGCFPRQYLEGEYGPLYYDEKHAFLDRNLEGVLLKISRKSFYSELALDWMGVVGAQSHERFQILSYGDWKAASWLDLGWTGSFYHYACSQASPGVVDNHVLTPFVRFDLSEAVGIQTLSLKASGVASYQWDRKQGDPAGLFGGEFDLRAGHWNVTLGNRLYLGDDIQPMYGNTDLAGEIYGSMLYFGFPCYQAGVYDCADLSWQPSLTPFLDLRLSLSFHFGDDGHEFLTYLGNMQSFSLIFNLDAFRSKDCVRGRAGSPAPRKKTFRGPRMTL